MVVARIGVFAERPGIPESYRGAVRTLPAPLEEITAHSAAPPMVAGALERLAAERPDGFERVRADPALAGAFAAVAAASRSLTRWLLVDPRALGVLADLAHRPEVPLDGPAEELGRWKHRELLRIAARDLLGTDSLVEVGAGLAAMADDVFRAAGRIAGVQSGLAVIGMGKLGGRELNYASDVDVIFVGEDQPGPLPVLAIARRCFRVDTNLRPEGRSGRLILPLAAYQAYWDRWARPWEFQALLKSRPIAGDPELGAAFARAATERVWERPFGADDIRALRDMKARAEAAVARKGLTHREVKRGWGGIRDAEFAVQLLQLVHGRRDEALRSRNTLRALAELASAGYVDPDDARRLGEGYRFLRTVEHRLQLADEQQVHAVPGDPEARGWLARVMGYRDEGRESALARFDQDLRRQQATVRAIHERLYFRPLLEAFTGPGPRTGAGLSPEAIEARLSAFGFADAEQTRRRVQELTRGLTRSSRLMEQMLPLVLDWLSQSPDPDLGLLGLGTLVGHAERVPGLVATFRASPEAARRLCLMLGTSRLFHRRLEQHPELLEVVGDDQALRPRPRADLVGTARSALAWRSDPASRQEALLRLRRTETMRVAMGDVLGGTTVEAVGAGLSDLADAVLQAGLEALASPVPLAVVAMGRFGGRELAYPSDLDVLVVAGGDSSEDFTAANRAAEQLLRLIKGSSPATRIYELDTGLRPEGRQGPLVRGLDGYRAYFERWGQTWERQALLRARPAAGDQKLGERFMALAGEWIAQPLTEEQVREIRRMKARIERERIPPREDPQFHLKLGRGSLADVEWTAQLLQLRQGIRSAGTMAALGLLEAGGAIDRADARALAESYRFCEQARNRWYLIKGSPGDALPSEADQLARLARSLGTTGPELREHYRMVTRRARAVMERLFYGIADGESPAPGNGPGDRRAGNGNMAR